MSLKEAYGEIMYAFSYFLNFKLTMPFYAKEIVALTIWV